MIEVALFDYGAGNIHSLRKALEFAGARVVVQSDASALLDAHALVLPGVGAFGAAAVRLNPAGHAVRVALQGGFPCLGICLGMQLLMEASHEGEGAGLGVLPGIVRRLRARRVPHMGWNDVEPAPDPLFEGLPTLTAYYANSFVVDAEDREDVIAWTQHEMDRFPAAVRRGNTWGVQFHPEKSGAAGLRLLRNFVGAAATAAMRR